MEPVLERAHTLATDAVPAGGVAVDATIGNGHDTAVLARAVGADGQVFGFDVQAAALSETRARLAEGGLAGRVELRHAGHETMERHIPDSQHGAVDAVMFNLGYLPGGDHAHTTSPPTTLPALDAAARLLRVGGVLTVVAYTGHEGGDEEAAAVDAWAADLPQSRFEALSYRFVNQKNDPPRLLAVEKLTARDEP